MGLIKEPKKVDFLIQSEPWSENELMELRKIMKAQKNKRKKQPLTKNTPQNKASKLMR